MTALNLIFSKSFLLKDYKNCPEGGGIYFHYIKTENNNYNIIYVGECLSFLLRQEEHFKYYDKYRATLFEIENGELNIKYIPDYDSKENFQKLKDELINKIYVICGKFENEFEGSLKAAEGAIINQLYRRSETRKYMLNARSNYILRNTEINLKEMDVDFLGLPTKIITPL